jgi:hypothetical protein
VRAVTRDSNRLVEAIADWGESVNSLNRLQREFEFTLLPGVRQGFNFTDDAQLVIGPAYPWCLARGRWLRVPFSIRFYLAFEPKF